MLSDKNMKFKLKKLVGEKSQRLEEFSFIIPFCKFLSFWKVNDKVSSPFFFSSYTSNWEKFVISFLRFATNLKRLLWKYSFRSHFNLSSPSGALPFVTASVFCFSGFIKWLIIISYSILCLWGLHKVSSRFFSNLSYHAKP